MGARKDLIILYRQEAHSSRPLAIYQIALAHFLPSLAIALHGCLRYQGPEVYQRAVCVMVNMIL